MSASAAGVWLSAAVMTHPAREGAARLIQAALPGLDPVVVVDPDPGKPESCLRNSRRAWAAADPLATHHLVLQDDIELAEDLLDRVLPALAEQPDHALCLFTEQGSSTSYAVRMAALAGFGRAPMLDRYLPSVALVLPAQAARSFAADEDESALQDDVALLARLSRTGAPMSILVPNPVEHRASPSLVGNDHMGARKAAWFRPGPTSAPDPGPGLVPERSDWLTADVPFVATDTGRIAAMLYCEDTQKWALGGFKEFVDRQQVDVQRMREGGGAGAAALRELRSADIQTAHKYMIGNLRDALYGAGFQAGRLGTCAELAGLDCLHTAPHGILRWTMPPEQQRDLREPIDTLLLDAAERGFADGRAARTGSAGPSGRGTP